MTGALIALGVKLVEMAGGVINKRQDALHTWELEAIRASSQSWKDEWLTIVFTLPLIVQIIGSLFYSFGFGQQMLEGGRIAIDNIENLGIPYGTVMLIIVSASFGIRAFRGGKR